MSTLIHTIQFNKAVSFTDHTGISFTNTTTGEVASTVASATLSPESVIQYDVTWSTDPIAGDVATWGYDGLGNYEDDSFAPDPAVPLDSGTIQITNCLNPTEGVTGFTANPNGSSSVNLTWLEPADTSLLSPYKLYRDGVYLVDIPLGETSYAEYGLNADTNYTYRLDTIWGGAVISSSSDSMRTEVTPEPLLLMPMDETSGDTITALDGSTYTPSDVGDGYIDFNVANAIRIQNDTDLEATPLVGAAITVNTRRVTIFAGHVISRNVGTSKGTRINVGLVSTNNHFSVSGVSSLHSSFGTLTEAVSDNPGSLVLPADTTMTIYGVVDGTVGGGDIHLFSKCIDTDGNVINNVSDLANDATGAIAPDNITLESEMRLVNGDYYIIGMWYFEQIPSQLHNRLAEWGRLARSGTKLKYLPEPPTDNAEWVTGDNAEWITGDNQNWIN